jgi:transposase
LVCTVHQETGRATVAELHAILEHIRPEVIFLEAPPEAFDDFYQNGSQENLESTAVRQYRGVIEIGCMAHARRKLHDLCANHQGDIAEEGLRYFAALYEIEREARELKLDADGRQRLRQQRSKPVAEALRQWLTRQRGQVPDGSATRKAIEYSLGRWAALIRYLDDGELPIDTHRKPDRPVALGRSNWLFAGSLRAGQRAANIMSLVQSAKLNGHDPDRYLKDVLERLPTQPASRLEELLPHRWPSQ